MKYNQILTKKFLIKEYIINKNNILKIAKENKCSYSTIRNYLIKYNVKIRTQKENLTGKNNGMYKDGRTLKKYYCIDCDKLLKNTLAYQHKRCRKCHSRVKMIKLWKNKEFRNSMAGKNNPMFGIHRFGKQSPNYIHGLSSSPYPLEFDNFLKEQIRKRDNYKCQICGKLQIDCNRKLDVHHKDYDKDNLNPENLISLCQSCHMKTNNNRNYWVNYFKSKELINA